MEKRHKKLQEKDYQDIVANAIANVIRCERALARAANRLDAAELPARETNGARPWALIAWRSYSAIGGSEIEKARDEFLKLPAIDPAKIEAEYRDAKRRVLAAIKAGEDWDRRAGVDELRREYEAAGDELAASEKALLALRPREPIACGRLLTFALGRQLQIVTHAEAAFVRLTKHCAKVFEGGRQ